MFKHWKTISTYVDRLLKKQILASTMLFYHNLCFKSKR